MTIATSLGRTVIAAFGALVLASAFLAAATVPALTTLVA
jgi:hypothetical protein